MIPTTFDPSNQGGMILIPGLTPPPAQSSFGADYPSTPTVPAHSPPVTPTYPAPVPTDPHNSTPLTPPTFPTMASPSSLRLLPPVSKEGRAIQAVIAGLGALAAETGMVLKGQKIPGLGRAGIVGLASAASALLGLIAGRAYDAGGKGVFDGFGTRDGVVDLDSLIIDLVSAAVIGSLASGLLGMGRGKMSAAVRGGLVGVAVALSSLIGDYVVSAVSGGGDQ